MGNPGRPSTSWPPSQEVVSRAAEKSDYLLLPVPPTECERVCVWLLKRFKSFEWGTYDIHWETKLANGQIATPMFASPAPDGFSTLPAFTAPLPPPTLTVSSRRRWASISIPMAGYDGTNED